MSTTLISERDRQASPQLNDFWLQIENLQRHPAYRTGYQTDPVRGLLAAVVIQAVKDLNPYRKIESRYRETAYQFLKEANGEWLKCFGISSANILHFVENLD